MSHYAPLSLQLDIARGTRIRFAHNPCGRVIVFVHGFTLKPHNTWVDFPMLAPGLPKCHGADLVFYQYNCLTTQPTSSGGVLRQFMQLLWQDAAAISNAVLPSTVHRPAGFRYQSLTLVAHSLGAVVTRYAMVSALLANPNPDPWVSQTKLILFAPAHKGAAITRLGAEGLTNLPGIGTLLTPITAAFKLACPPLRALEPGSQVLEELERRCTEIRKTHAGASLRAAHVVWGQHDNVVENLMFADDPTSEVIIGKGHSNVCKPSPHFTRPLEILESHL